MIVLRAALAHRQYVMARPPLGEFRTDGVQPVHKLDKMRLAGTTAVVGTEPGERVLGSCRPFDDQRSQRRVGEEKPNHIPFVRWYLLEIQEEGTSCAIPSEHVPSATHNKGRHDVRLIEHSLEPRADRFALRRGIDSRLATREPKQLDPLDGIKL